EIIGNKTKCKIVKNKVAPPFKEVIFDIMYGEGVSRIGEIIDFAVEADIIEKSGAWFSYNGERLGQGRDKVKKLLAENTAMCEEIANKVKEHSNEIFDKAFKKPIADKIIDPEIPLTVEDDQAIKSSPIKKKTDASAAIDIDVDESDFK
ncbi:MAG: DNA recombination/repair protein RecA, partial [Oscillospiraceae bacterium]